MNRGVTVNKKSYTMKSTRREPLSSKGKSKAKKYVQPYLMLFPSLLIFAILSIYPIAWALKYVLYSYNGYTEPVFVGTENFVRLFTRDIEFWESVKNTFIYAGGKMLIILPLAFIMAVLLNGKRRRHTVLQAIVFSPTIMSAAVMSLVFYLILNVYNGDLNRYLIKFGIVDSPINWLGAEHAMLSTIIVAVWAGLGNYMVYFLAGLQSIPNDIFESGKIDGTNTIQRLWYLTIPMLGPVLKIIIMLSLINAFQDMSSILVLTGGGPFGKTNVMFLYIYSLYFPVNASDASTFMPQYGYGAAVSIVAAGIVGIITLIYLKVSKKMDDIY